MRDLVKKPVAFGFGLVLTVLLLTAVISTYNTILLHETDKQVAHTHAVLEELEALLSALKDAETGQRGYLLTGNSEFLQPYNSALTGVPREVWRLRELTKDNPRQIWRIVALQESVKTMFAELERTIELRQTQGLEAAQKVVAEGEGKKAMDEIRRFARDMEETEERLLQGRSGESQRSYFIALAANLVAFPISAGTVGVALVLVRRELSARRLAEQAAQEQSERLRKLAVASLNIHSASSLAEVVRCVTEEARHLIGAHLCSTRLNAAESRSKAIGALSHSEKYAGEQSNGAAPGAGFDALVSGSTGPRRFTQVELEAQPAWQLAAAKDRPPRGLLAAPLMGRDGDSLGSIQLSDRYFGDFTEDEEAVLVQLAHLASVAIENAGLNQELREADRRKDEFLATLAHELRNPLAPIRNALEMLRLRNDDADSARGAREMMERQVRQMVRLIDDLLDVSRITRGKVELRKERIELAEAVRGAVETSRPVIEASGHVLTVNLPRAPIYLDADPTRLSQVLSNLLNNSARYTDPGGHISLTAIREGEQAILRVRDNGIGIAAEMLGQIFEPFTQADRTRDPAQGGLGIGLTLVRQLVELHGGTVTAESAGEGQGSEFIVRLPLPQGQEIAVDERPARTEPIKSASRRVLVVDDNKDAAESLSVLLRMLGYDIETVYDGPSALAAAGRDAPEVVLLDIGLPGMNGYDVARQLRQRPELMGLKIVALTGWGQEEDRRKSREAGFDHHLVKPVEPEVVLRLLASFAAPVPSA